MQLSDLDFYPAEKKLRQFGVLLVLFGALIPVVAWLRGWTGEVFLTSALPLENQTPSNLANSVIWNSVALYFASMTFTVWGLAGFFHPNLLRLLFVTWMIVAFPIGWSISQGILLLIFIGVFLPIGIYFRLTGRDALHLKRANETTAWKSGPGPLPASRYFQQF